MLAKPRVARFSGYYDMETLKQDKTTFKEKAAAATNEHDFYNSIREWIGHLAENDGMSWFVSPKEIATTTGNDQPYAGVGMNVNGEDPKPFLIALAVRPDGPAGKAGIKPRDKILAIDGEDCPKLSKLRGVEGTEVTLTVQTPGEEPRDITLTRTLFTDFPLEYQKTFTRLEQEPKIGYFYMGFVGYNESDPTNTDILKKLMAQDTLKQPKALTGLILDLRYGNDGHEGTVNQFLGHFVSGTRYGLRGALDNNSAIYISKQEPDLHDLPLAVLIDESSTIVGIWLAAVLQERDNTVVIGQPTSPFPIAGGNEPLKDGSEFFFPSVTFYINKGNNAKSEYVKHEDGRVYPDVSVEGNGFLFSVEDDPYVQVALAELAKLQEVSQ